MRKQAITYLLPFAISLMTSPDGCLTFALLMQWTILAGKILRRLRGGAARVFSEFDLAWTFEAAR